MRVPSLVVVAVPVRAERRVTAVPAVEEVDVLVRRDGECGPSMVVPQITGLGVRVEAHDVHTGPVRPLPLLRGVIVRADVWILVRALVGNVRDAIVVLARRVCYGVQHVAQGIVSKEGCDLLLCRQPHLARVDSAGPSGPCLGGSQ
jgi:hypothetical protein